VTTDVRQNFGFQPELTDGFTVLSGLLGSGGRGEFDILHSESVECSRDGDFGLGIEEGIGELFALCSLN
jgi:hypothetical protein